MAAIVALSAAEPFLTRFAESALAASSRRLQARARRRPTDAGSDCPTQAAGAGRSQVQLRPAAPDTGVDSQPRPGTHSSTVHGSPSSQVEPLQEGVVESGMVVVVVASPTRIGSLRAKTSGRLPKFGSGTTSRTSYHPLGRSAGIPSVTLPLLAPPVHAHASMLRESPYVAPSA